MAKKSSNTFYVSSTAVTAYSGASDFNTDAMDLSKFQGAYVLYLYSDHSSGTPTATVQVSYDGTTWFDYRAETTTVSLPISISDDEFLPKYARIVYVANSSNGNVTFKFDPVNE